MDWKPVKTSHKCQALDRNGKRCKYKAEWVGPIFVGECQRTYNNNDTAWVQTKLCRYHASEVK